ncbi:GDSL-type esterase/lipase family protein [Telluria mixta]|uniref:GDSL-type esterase/lipase family protein n=1 Tax=Telluria mixta TaxID=34071 RepID=A0ABT2BSD3_9BURK|nr:SGNH/GDSL hydrolase family protein [Telluria mixta]MCS0627902.1 GDSL-type esterase/lipase family protein [Telluria mixta]WEM93979.1 SGNH/GDSL hydrolase family protein [Telluria mixta]
MITTNKRNRRVAIAFALAAGLLHVALAAGGVPIAPDDRKLLYTGRVDFTNPKAPVITWPSTSVAGNFTGTSLAVTLDDEKGKNYFNVFIDGPDGAPLILQADQGSKTYAVASGLAPGRHSFLITKRTEGEEGATVLRGLELADGGQLLPPPPRPVRRIEFFGDSITSGMGDEAPMNGRDDMGRDKNSYLSYAAVTARALDAELHMTSQSGIGVMISWFPFTMPDFYDQLSAVGNNDTRWDFTRWTPDVVVVNLLQNDSWLIGRDHKLQPEPDEQARIAAYAAFVQRVRQLYPRAYIVCALGSMDATRAGSPWPGYVRTAVERMHAGGDTRIDTLFFDYTGYTQHPRLKHHQDNAARLTAFIRRKMGW